MNQTEYPRLAFLERQRDLRPNSDLLSSQKVDNQILIVFGKTNVAELRCHAKGAETQSDDRYSANRSASVTSLQKAIIEKRLKEVCRLLADSTLTISEIAVRCGYRDANYLKNLFKRRYNMSMRDWRKQNSQK